jgi:hypothetical protein
MSSVFSRLRVRRSRAVFPFSRFTWSGSINLFGFDPARFGQAVIQPSFGSRNILTNFRFEVCSSYPVCFCLSIVSDLPAFSGQTFYVAPPPDDAPHLFTRNPESLVFFDLLPPVPFPRVYENRLVRWNKSGNQVLVLFLFIPALPGYRPLQNADRFFCSLSYDMSSP